MRLGRTITRTLVTMVAGSGLTAMALSAQAVVQERVDLDAVAKIRDEGLNRSRLDSIVGYITDVLGPRLTNSPANREANRWAAETFSSWGLANVRIEPWDSTFGRGWERVSYAGRILEPFVQPLNATAMGWSGSTRGTITCPVVAIEVNDTTDLAKYTGKLKGACVMRDVPDTIGPEFEPITRRRSLEDLLAPSQPQQTPNQARQATFRQRQELNARVNQWLRTQQPAALLQQSVWTYNILRVGGHPDGRLARDSAYDPTPALVVSHEHYGQLYRNVRRGIPVKLELNVRNRFFDKDRRGYNVLAEIPGTSLPNEVVMLGAHYDSWHTGTGATDNAAGSAAMMEAVRILKTLGLPMKRTVRIALWSGEEQGLIGSRAWVRMHRDELPRISAYVNLDNGTGKIRGIWNQSNEAVTPIFEQILFPFRDLGVVAVRHGNTGGTDHLAFDAVGVPGFNFIQDPIEYGIRSHHSNADTYERLLIDDLEQAATVIAWTVYHIANRDEMMPRKEASAAAN
ncbi:MAG TPA: M20/M25/M40 family metallo-hydrolase [Gemmatimonadaceae bacterium]|nr:M20/M25/M40 family metallo-hydrolase [Gemmatimonadaceae bacterium]